MGLRMECRASERLTSVGASCAEAEVPSEEAALWRVSFGQGHELSLSLRLSAGHAYDDTSQFCRAS